MTRTKKWKQDLVIVLGIMDIDLAVMENQLDALNEVSPVEANAINEKWMS